MPKAPTDIRSLARSYCPSALNVLRGIMENKTCPASARVAAATALIDRGYGKPHQTSEVTVNKRVSDMSDEEIIARIDELRRAGTADGPATTEEDTPVLN